MVEHVKSFIRFLDFNLFIRVKLRYFFFKVKFSPSAKFDHFKLRAPYWENSLSNPPQTQVRTSEHCAKLQMVVQSSIAAPAEWWAMHTATINNLWQGEFTRRRRKILAKKDPPTVLYGVGKGFKCMLAQRFLYIFYTCVGEYRMF